MRTFKFYFYRDNHIVRAQSIACWHDEPRFLAIELLAATEPAVQAVEVWMGYRLIHRAERNDAVSEAAAATAPSLIAAPDADDADKPIISRNGWGGCLAA